MAITGSTIGPAAAIGTTVISVLVIAIRHDNDLGYCLPLTILFLLAIGVLCLLLVLMAVALKH